MTLALASLAGCGGEDAPRPGGSPASTAPTPTPTPTPTPATTTANQFSIGKSPFSLGQTAPFSYAVLGFSVAGADGAWDYVIDPSSLDTTIALGFRLAAPDDLRLSIGNLGEASIQPNGGGGISHTGEIQNLGFNALGGSGSLNVQYGPKARVLANVANVFWARLARSSGNYPSDLVNLIYGVPTASASVPGSGTFTYASCCDSVSASIDVNFNSGAMIGSIPLDEKEQIALKDVVIGSDRSTFSGSVVTPGGAKGTIEGRFAGPAAEDIMARVIYPVSGGRSAMLIGFTRAGSI
jgi:hypothetical protein